MLNSDTVRIHHILDAATEALSFSQNRSKEDLYSDRMLSLALIRLLEIIGEAARGISPAFRGAHSELPWQSMAGMRDRLVHGYFDVDLDVVWETVSKDLPQLINQLKKIAQPEK